jgi:hypothetical protein
MARHTCSPIIGLGPALHGEVQVLNVRKIRFRHLVMIDLTQRQPHRPLHSSPILSRRPGKDDERAARLSTVVCYSLQRRR